MASSIPAIQGFPYSRGTRAPCCKSPPTSRMMAEALINRGVQPGAVARVTRISPGSKVFSSGADPIQKLVVPLVFFYLSSKLLLRFVGTLYNLFEFEPEYIISVFQEPLVHKSVGFNKDEFPDRGQASDIPILKGFPFSTQTNENVVFFFQSFPFTGRQFLHQLMEGFFRKFLDFS